MLSWFDVSGLVQVVSVATLLAPLSLFPPSNSAKVLVKGEPNVSYICSRYYRAPELIFGATDYTSSIGACGSGARQRGLRQVDRKQ